MYRELGDGFNFLSNLNIVHRNINTHSIKYSVIDNTFKIGNFENAKVVGSKEKPKLIFF